MSEFEPDYYRSDEEEDDKVRRQRGEDDDDDDEGDEEKDGNEDEEEEEEEEFDEDADEEEEEEEDHVENLDEDSDAAATKPRLGVLDAADGDEEEEGGGYGYLKKFHSNVRYSMVEEHHPELLVENNEDVQARTQIHRDDQGNIVDDPHHRTMPLLTKYEKARVLGERAKQLNSGAKPFIDVPETVLDGYLIALMEFEAKKIPFIIKRPLRNGTCEYWKVCDLETL